MDNLIELFNKAQQAVMDMGVALETAILERNTEIVEYNKLVDLIEAEEALKVKESENARTAVAELMKQRDIAIEAFEKKAIELNDLRNQLNQVNKTNSELMAIDPKRLVKVNKAYQSQIAELKASLATSEEARKAMSAKYQSMLKQTQDTGVTNLHVYENGNSIRFAPGVRVRKGNDFGGVAETPVIEFFHKKCGIMRLGTLLEDGSLGWSSAANSMPSTEESNMAMFKIHEYCDARKIKYPKKDPV